MDKELIKYCLSVMATKEQIIDMLADLGCKPAKISPKKNEIVDSALKESKINIKCLTQYFRGKWEHTNIDIHLNNLKSGKLVGHDWHGAMPSFLHRSLQDRVRECAAGKWTVDELLNIGADIMKQEYFIVAQHDILETSIIEHFKDAIPPISSKSITDFVFKGTPVDLKVSGYPTGWTERVKTGKQLTSTEKKKLIADMYMEADSERIRKQANESINNWGFNRMYVFIKDQDEWFSDPDGLVKRVLKSLEKTSKPYTVDIKGSSIEAFCIEV